MDAQFLRLKCLELAMVQARNESKHQDLDAVAEIQERFYTIVSGGDDPFGSKASAEPQNSNAPLDGRPRKSKADKDQSIFG